MNRNLKKILSLFLLLVLLLELYSIFQNTFSNYTRNIGSAELYTNFEINEYRYKRRKKSFFEHQSKKRFPALLFRLASTARTTPQKTFTAMTLHTMTSKQDMVTPETKKNQQTFVPTIVTTNLKSKHVSSQTIHTTKTRNMGKINIYQYDDICFQGDTYAMLWNVLFPQFPATSDFITSLEEKQFSSNDNRYGSRISGYITPQVSEYYEFQVICPLGCELIITGPNEIPNNPPNILLRFGTYKKITLQEKPEADAAHSVNSDTAIYMKAGENYLLDFTNVLSQSGRFIIRWKRKSSADFEMIPSEVLTPFDPSGSLTPPSNNIVYVQKTEKSVLIEENRKNLFQSIDYLNRAKLERCNYTHQSFMPDVVKEGYGTVYVQKDLIYPYDPMIDHHWSAGTYPLFLNSSKAQEIAQRYMKHIEGNFTLQHIVHMEENNEEIQGKRYFIELDVKDSKEKVYRTSRWIFLKKDGGICEPNGYQWNSKEKIYLLTPVKNQRRWIHYLVKSLNDIILATGDKNLHLIVVDYSSTDTIVKDILKTANFPFTFLEEKGKFSKVKGLNLAVKSIEESDALMFVLDLQLQLPLFLFDYIRKHTFKSRTAYVPILLRLACGQHPVYTNLTQSSIWQEIGYGMISIYKSDWNRVGGMNETKFGTKWGGEDWDFVEQVIKGKIEVIHHRLPGYYHLYHSTKGSWDGTKLH